MMPTNLMTAMRSIRFSLPRLAVAYLVISAAAPAANAWQSADRITPPPAIVWKTGNNGASDGARDTVLRDAIPPPVQKDELEPVMSNDGSGLPFELWRGLTNDQVETLISQLEIPPRSPALHTLWKRLITAQITAPSGAAANGRFTALRIEALYRSGLAKEAQAEIAKSPQSDDALLAVLSARNELASGDTEKACQTAQKAATAQARMPKQMRAQAILLSGYCAALHDDAAGAGLAADLAREEGQEPSPGLAALDALSIGAKPKIVIPKTLSLLDYRLVERAGGIGHADILEKGEPALLVALATDAKTPIDLGLTAAEKAAALNAMPPELLAAIYRANAGEETADTLISGGQLKGAFRRAALFKAAESERTPMKKTRLMRAFVNESSTSGLHFQALQMLAPAASALAPQPEIGWFAETAAEIGIASGQYDQARRWIASASDPGRPGGNLDHWLALADIADPNFAARGESLGAIEGLARNGRIKPDDLHRVATVLDALSYNVPIPLWDAASRTPQPSSGYLPETGVLSELQDASKKKEFGRTVLLAMKSLGPNGAEGAHMIALGDSIRALKRAGLEPDARRLGLEALLGAWPHSTAN